MEQRKLKVYAKFAKTGNRNRRNPEIRLTGKWVANWGIKEGTNIIVRNLEYGVIILNNKSIMPPIIHF